MEESAVQMGVLVLVGSAREQARAQVERLAEQGALVLTLSREAVINQDETILMGIRSGAAVAMRTGRNVVVRSENWPGAAEVTMRLAAKRGIPAEEIERRVLAMLARVGEGVLAATGSRRVVVVGTETGRALCRQINLTEPLLLTWIPGGADEPDAIALERYR